VRSSSRADDGSLGFDRQAAVLYFGLFLLAFFAYASLWRSAPLIGVDTPRYLDAARDLADFHIDQLQFRTPGYPLLLLATGSAEKPVRLLFYVSLILHFAAVWLLATILQSLGFRRTFLVAWAVILLLPPFVENAAYALSETLTQFTLAAGFAGVFHWFRTRRQWLLWGAAIAFAYAGLTRPTYQVTGVAVAALIAVCWRTFRQPGRDLARAVMALTVVTVLTVGGYATLNYIKFGFFGVTPMLGFHLSTKTIRVLERIPDRDRAVRSILIAHRDAHLTQPNSSHTGYMYIWSALPELQRQTGMNTAQLSRYMMRLNLRLIAAAPLDYVMEVFRAASAYWFPAVTPVASMNSRLLQAIWSALHFLLLGAFAVQAVLVVGSTAFLVARRRRRTLLEATGRPAAEWLAYAIPGLLIVYTMLVSILVESGVARVRTPVDIFMVLSVFIGLRIWTRQVVQDEVAAAPPQAMAVPIPVRPMEASVR
jgi:hypothetical protein